MNGKIHANNLKFCSDQQQVADIKHHKMGELSIWKKKEKAL